jgi:hypothetical protein
MMPRPHRDVMPDKQMFVPGGVMAGGDATKVNVSFGHTFAPASRP